MRVERKDFEEKNNLNIIFLIFVSILLLLLITYFTITIKIKKKIVKGIENINNNYVEISYKKLNIIPTPIFVKIKFSNFNIKLETEDGKMNFEFNDLIVKKSMFTKDVNIILPEKATLNNFQKQKLDILFGKNYINLSLNKNLGIDNIDSAADQITLESKSNNNKIVSKFMNMTFRTIKVASDEYVNMTSRFNIDKITTKLNDEEFESESNIEIVVSNIKELDSTKEIISVTNLIDTFIYNDISNNYAIELKGNFNADRLTKNLTIDTELEIKNYNSLIRAINNKDIYHFVNKNKISSFIQILELAPESDKNTENNKYYKVIGNSLNKLLLINNVNINEIMKNMFYKR